MAFNLDLAQARSDAGVSLKKRASQTTPRRIKRLSPFQRRCCGFDGLDGVFKRLLQNSLADGPEHEAEQPPLKVLSLAHDYGVEVGRPVGFAREGVGPS